MKLLLRSNPWPNDSISRAFKALFYTTKTPNQKPTFPSSSSSSHSIDSLYSRISRAGNPRASIVPVVEQWLDQGNQIKTSQLQSFIKSLRKYRRYTHALQISEWMSEQRKHELSVGDVAVQLDLISKVQGLEQAEKYFDSINESMRDYKVYGALLNCYAYKRSMEKAEALMQKMRELGFVRNSLPYNAMLRLYSQMGKREKLDVLVQEMEEKGISYDKFTLNIQLNSYAAASDFEKMEKLLMQMEADPLVTMDWHSYLVAANGYLKAGVIEKALTMLRRGEQLIRGNSRRLAYEVLLTLYAATRNKDEVYRIWNFYKNLGRFHNSGYLCMISSLVKLEDIDGAEKIYEEWESRHNVFDCRIPNLLISGYCQNLLLGKAEAYVNRLIESGFKPDAITWDRLATGYQLDCQMTKAVETMKKAVLACQAGWKPNIYTLAACLEYLKSQGDVEAAEELLSLLREKGHFSTNIFNELMNKVHSENLGSRALDQMERDDQTADGETKGCMELKRNSSS
ncbi:PPR domain-containing protein [Cephalotus follicularis]|uniref:PPR domain-containing protein n=1 Tax=Cephalotus follicularis TaxID=3775 RepID=A0A1Q3BRA0_CEPFO|nr:PPR domain-containing protein [Cephalotus follicularis]